MAYALPFREPSFLKAREGFRSKRALRFIAGWISLVLAVESLSSFVAFLMLLNAPPDDSGPPQYWQQIILLFVATIVFFSVSYYFYSTWKRCQELTVDELLQLDPRPPILYLRPFKADKLRYPDVNSKSHARIATAIGGVIGLMMRFLGSARSPAAEELMVGILKERGPVIAIGRPKERIPPVGAARIYVGDEWKDVVRKYLEISQMVLMFAGTTPGFAWELGEIFRSAPFKPTMIVLPFCLKRHKAEEVAAFVNTFSEASGHALDADLRQTRAIYFRQDKQPVYVIKQNAAAEAELDSINPFLFPVTQMVGIEDAAWSADYVAAARARAVRTRNRTGLVIAGIVIVNVLVIVLRLANASTP